MCDARERGGLQLPNLELYHDACCLVWVRDWIMLEEEKLLTLEGFNRLFGWHAYLLYDKEKSDTMFKHHFIRGSLLQAWNKYRINLPDERPLWIILEEVISFIAGGKRNNPLKYKDLTKREGETIELKTDEELNHK